MMIRDDQWLPRAGEMGAVRGGVTANVQCCFWGDEIALKLHGAMDAQVYEFTKKHCILNG